MFRIYTVAQLRNCRHVTSTNTHAQLSIEHDDNACDT